MFMTKLLRIAIDGPGGAGKSTIAKAVSIELGIDYVDTGAMYRAAGYKLHTNGIGPEDTREIVNLMDKTDIAFSGGAVYLDGENVEKYIRTEQVSKLASEYSKIGVVRQKLVDIQKRMAQKQSLVMDGRDIGTNVIPDAEYKFFITADPEERAKRRYLQQKEKSGEADFQEILKDIKDRDWKDTHREINPLRRAEDAVNVDTTEMNIEQVCDFILSSLQRDDNGDII